MEGGRGKTGREKGKERGEAIKGTSEYRQHNVESVHS